MDEMEKDGSEEEKMVKELSHRMVDERSLAVPLCSFSETP